MLSRTLNLARRPFSNQAPVLRVGALLAVLALILLLVNVARYRSYFLGRGEEARQELSQIDRRTRELDKELAGLQRELGEYDIESLNQQVEFLNLRIRERIFGWSRLFEDLEAVVPADVRLLRLAPQQLGEGSGNVALAIQGVARSEEGLLDLIDAMFAHQRFRDPNPSRQTERSDRHEFNLTVVYVPPRRARGREAQAVEEGTS